MVTYIESGNIFSIEGICSYAHGCNCAGAMGKGIALQFKKKFPQMYHEYKNLCIEGKFKPGDVFEYQYKNNCFIFNLATQKTWRTKAQIKAIEKSLLTMLHFASNVGIKQIALPKIGSSLGGLEWPKVKASIERTSNFYPEICLIVVENFKSC